MDTYEGALAAWESELREKYNTKDREKLASEKKALPDGSYPIADAEDLGKAIHAVGRGGADHDAIRKHVIAQAKKLGLSKQIPDNWNADGSLKGEASDGPDTEKRAQCPTCEGTGKIMDGNRECPDCHGSGERSSTPPVQRRRKQRHRAMPLLPEVRHWRTDGLEVRSSSTSDKIVISGSPIVYDADYDVHDAFGTFSERMAPGVATGVLDRGVDVRFLFNHDGLPLARSISGTLTLSDTPTHLNMRAELDPRQQLANDLAIAIERGDVSQMSCGFIVARDEWDDDEEHRNVQEFADLLDVSAVTYPASPTTDLQIAQRMAMEVPVESRARLRRMSMALAASNALDELRAGKALSGPNKDHVVAAVQALHALLASTGTDPRDLMEQNDDEPQSEKDGEGVSGHSINEDGTSGGSQQEKDGGPGVEDGTGTRQVDPGEKMRRRSAASLRFQMELQRRKIKA